MGINLQAPARRIRVHLVAPLMIILTASVATMLSLHPASARVADQPAQATLTHR
jgi:hypothetical protein